MNKDKRLKCLAHVDVELMVENNGDKERYFTPNFSSTE